LPSFLLLTEENPGDPLKPQSPSKYLLVTHIYLYCSLKKREKRDFGPLFRGHAHEPVCELDPKKATIGTEHVWETLLIFVENQL
jgi:hypothetical protein